MSSKRHKSKRTRSPSSRRNSSEDRSDHSPKRRRNEDEPLQKILKSIDSLAKRMETLESQQLQRDLIPSVSDVHEGHEYDSLSIMADIADLDHSPSHEASTEPIKAPVGPNGAPQTLNVSSSGPCIKAQEDSANAENISEDHSLFDPLASTSSWTTSASFSKFLETNFRRKLSYQQSLVILEEWVIPEVDALQAPKLDQQLLNQIPTNVKRFIQERDKEMFAVQRAFLNATGLLCIAE